MKVKTIFIISAFMISLFAYGSLNAQEKIQDTAKVKNKIQEKEKIKHGPRFVDEDGDGFNDNAPDHDGDGIPNGLDPDYQGKGKKKRFIDLDGDGINDNVAKDGTQMKQRGFGPKGKSSKQGIMPQDGTGKQKGKGKNSGR